MHTIAAQRQLWNREQKTFRQVLLSGERHELALELGLRQHAQLHAAAIAHPPHWSYPDVIFAGTNEAHTRYMPVREEHSIAWLIWHIARIEDVAMNLLVAGAPQVLVTGGWQERLGIAAIDTGNAMAATTIATIAAAIDIDALRGYRLAVGRRTREIIATLTPAALKQPVDGDRLQQVLAQGAVVPEAGGLLDYWGRRTIAGLLLMPATRHNLVHLNEAFQLKEKAVRAA